ncbi:DUF1254 domain-containing protein [Microbacterium sp. 1.5R]|uniref:DUF1254 domain-containing protein n=1 Tax=Microbacterium sp. 1.5R TaxID=1916917 RepID=UPI0018DD4623|nr:DUF1254 domain-containing protein [Microbacterium sp. 1.5R]
MTDYVAANQRFVTCSNQDVVYGLGFAALDVEPVVVQVPDFGDRFWVTAVWDARTDSFANLGAQYGTAPGFYLIVGPDWDGEEPAGITRVIRSSTDLVAYCPRVFLNDTAEDRAAIQPVLNQTMIYPLSHYDGTVKTKDWSSVPSFPAPPIGDDEIRWVDPEKVFAQLPTILETVPPLPGEEGLYETFRTMLRVAEPATLNAIAVSAEQELIAPLFHWRFNGPPAGNGWYSPTNSAQFGFDYATRAAVARSSMFQNTPSESKYVFTETDSDGVDLDGTQSYAITFAPGQTPPVEGFWSVTLYNSHHFYNANPLERYSLGTKNQTLVYEDDGSLVLYAGPEAPVAGRESNWLPASADNFTLLIRGYWPERTMLDTTWTPPTVTRIN